MKSNLLSIKNLIVSVNTPNAENILVDNIDLDIPENSIIGLVGGSGSGKTTTGLSILRLLPVGLKIKKGNIFYNNKDILTFSEAVMRSIRGRDISMIFQEPLSAFNPVFTIGFQIEESLKIHTKLNQKEIKDKILELLNTAGIKDPLRVSKNYPHQLSGGMRQRAMIALAISANPKLIIADEPTSNLDVTLQAKIMDLFINLKKKFNLSILLITHDLGMVSHLADKIAVMNKGKIVEKGLTKDILQNPKDKYTQELMESLL